MAPAAPVIYKRSSDVITTDLGDKLILLDPRTGEMFGLDARGRRVWLALPAASVAQLAETICAEFHITPDRARADIVAVLAALSGAKLIVHEDVAA